MFAITVRYITLFSNAFLTLLSILMLLIAIFAWIKPPDANISPMPIAEHHQYSVAVIFLIVISICIFGLALLGIVSILVGSSFFLSLYILVLLVQISVQVLLSAFAIANRDKIHATIMSQWKDKLRKIGVNCTQVIGVMDERCESPLNAQSQAERVIFILLLIFFIYQVILLCLSCYYCEVLTKKERYEAIERDNNKNEE